MADIDMEAKAAVVLMLVNRAERRPRNGQRHVANAPAAQHETQPIAINHERHAEEARSEPLAHPMRGVPAAFFLRERKPMTAALAPPHFAPASRYQISPSRPPKVLNAA